MLKKVIACTVLFLVIVGAHAAWVSTRLVGTDSGCGSSCGPESPPVVSIQPVIPGEPAACDSCASAPAPVGLSGYIKGQDYFLGLSYGLSGAFALYALWIFVDRRRAAAAAGAAGGLTLAGLVSAACCGGGCFAAGCCGSPTLPILASFIGGTFLSFMKPLAFGVTLLSIAFGFWWISRGDKKAKAPCECSGSCCGT